MAMKGNLQDLLKRYNEMTMSVKCDCTLTTELVGGLPADEEGLKAFIKHHLGLEGAEAEEAYMRISTEELQDVSITPVEGEIEEKLTYGVRAIRKTELGPYLGDWMVKACTKQAFSLADIFSTVRRSKAFLAEGGKIEAWGDSLKEPDHPEKIYLTGDGDLYYQKFHGRVRVGMTLKSIVHHSECAPPGMRFQFVIKMIRGDIKDSDVVDFLPLMMNCGLGSARSLERGHFAINSFEIIDALKPREKESADAKAERLKLEKEAKLATKKTKKSKTDEVEPRKPAEVDEPVAA